MKKLVTFLGCIVLSMVVGAQTCPTTIRVGTNCSCHSCSGTIDVLTYETYVKRVLPQEWLNCWGSKSGGMNSLQAGAVAIRSYTIPKISLTISSHGTNYDICNTTCCHVYGTSQYTNTDNAVDNTQNIVLVSSNTIQLSEYSAENNDNNNPSSSCGNCYSGGNGWPCISDNICCGKTFNGHGRGMCQNGSARWATGLDLVNSSCTWQSSHGYGTKTWQQILSHYYPNWTLTTCGSTPCTPPNDNCASATTITSNGVSLSGTVACATGSYGANQCLGCSCASPDDKDVYYKFTAQATSHTVTVSNYASNFDAVIELRTACASGSSNYISCYDPSGTPSSVSYTWNNLTVNQTYYIRIFEFNSTGTPPSSSTFTVSVTHTSSNKPDLTVTANTQNISPTTVCAGATISAWCSEDNSGNATAGANSITLWLSTDATLTTANDTYLGSITGFPSINAGSNSAVRTNSSVTIPSNTPAGTYYLYFWVDGLNDNGVGNVVSESDEQNNFASRQITVNPLPSQPNTISGNPTVCSGTSQTYSISSVSGATSYIWSYSGNGTVSGTGTSVTFSPTSSGTLSVKANNSCGSGLARTLNVSVQPSPVADLTANQQSGFAPLTVTFNDASSNNPTQWEWTFPGGSPNTSNAQNPTITYPNSGLFNVTLRATNSCGNNTTIKSNYINVIEPVGFENIEQSDKLHIFPNPNNGTFRITADIKVNNLIRINLFSLSGQNIYSKQIVSTSNQIDETVSIKDIAKGVYIVQLKVDQKFMYKKIVIE